MNPANKTILLHQKIFLIFFGLFLTIVILEIGLRIGGFTILSMQEHRNLQSMKQKGSFRIICLGESTTQGQYPVYLEEILNQRNIRVKFSVVDKGLVGADTEGILSRLEDNLDKYRPDMVVTMMGINDKIGNGRPYKPKTASAFYSLKVCKLTKLIWLRMITKPKEIYEKQDFLNQEQALKSVLELNPKDVNTCLSLAWLYKRQEKFIESEQAFKKALELNPVDDNAYEWLGQLYIDQEKFIESEQAFKKALETNPKNYHADEGLATIYRWTNKNELFKIYAEKVKNGRADCCNVTATNYLTLKQILDKRKIRLICAQYPMRSIEPLKKVFIEQPDNSIIFVDNEKIFKDAIKKEGYKEYFRDMFGGDFGHCTNKGNRLLAENVANTILKEYFNK